MKKSVLVLVLAVIAAGGLFAEGWYNSYAPGIEGSKMLINAGVGFGILPYKLKIPPISASAEYALAKIPLSIGGYFGIAGYGEDFGVFDYKGTMMGIGPRASWHFGFVKNLDVYGSVTLGYLMHTQTYSYPEINYGYGVTTPGGSTKYNLGGFFYAFNVGARYFFTRNIGAYLELGYSPISVVSAGLSVKF